MAGSTSIRGKKVLGRRGEDEACLYLVGKGHTILERNWRTSHLEIDIVSLDKNGIHFVEVKSRTAPLEADPQDSVTYTKQKRITKAAMSYMGKMDKKLVSGDTEVFFDVAAVIFDGDRTIVEYFPQAYIPIYI